VVPYLLGLLVFLTYPKELDGELIPVSGGLGAKLWERLRVTGKGFLGMFRDPATLRGLLQSAAFDGVFKGTKDYLQPILKSQALALPLFLSLSGDQRTALVVGVVYAVLYLGTSLAASSAGKVERRFSGLTRAVNLSYLAGLTLLAGAGLATQFELYPLAVLAFAGLYLLQNVRRPLMVGYLAEVIDPRLIPAGGAGVRGPVSPPERAPPLDGGVSGGGHRPSAHGLGTVGGVAAQDGGIGGVGPGSGRAGRPVRGGTGAGHGGRGGDAVDPLAAG